MVKYHNEHLGPLPKTADQELRELQEAKREMHDLIRELGEVLHDDDDDDCSPSETTKALPVRE